jgi:HAD superfamily hydrolase (TIGR01509 family)
LLERLKGHKLGIVTNGVPELQRDKLEGSGLKEKFNATVISGDIDVGKPQPGIFEHICRELQVDAAECVMVGDNPERDIAGAIAAGMKSVWVDRGFRPANPRFKPDLEVKNLLEILPWLHSLTWLSAGL